MKRAILTLLALTLASSVTGVRAELVATPSEATERIVSVVFGGTSHSPAQSLRGASLSGAWQVGAGIETRPLQRPGDSGLGRADVSAEARRERDLSRWQLVPKLPSEPAGGAPLSNGASSSVQGRASWYEARGDIAAAPWWRFGMDPVWATVTHFRDGQSFSVTVLIQDFCQCYVGTPQERAIDLSDDAFRQLAPLSVGVLTVTIEVPGQGPRVTAPPTDTAP